MILPLRPLPHRLTVNGAREGSTGMTNGSAEAIRRSRFVGAMIWRFHYLLFAIRFNWRCASRIDHITTSVQGAALLPDLPQ